MSDGDTGHIWSWRTGFFTDRSGGRVWGRVGNGGEPDTVRLVVAALAEAADRYEVWNPTVVIRLAGEDFAALADQRLQLRQRLAALITSGLSAQRRSVGQVRVIIEAASLAHPEPFVIHNGGHHDAVPTWHAGVAEPIRSVPLVQPVQQGQPPCQPPGQPPGQPPTAPWPVRPPVREPALALRIRTDGRRIPVPRTELVLGRAVPLPGRLADRKVGRRHCVVRADGVVLVCADLRSTNGTWVDEVRIHEPARVHVGQVLRVGRTELAVEQW